ncbi:MAG: hypothetical protein JWP66_1532 [Naasia sp.]|nr:hypothetical protein [Naasia sp.]
MTRARPGEVALVALAAATLTVSAVNSVLLALHLAAARKALERDSFGRAFPRSRVPSWREAPLGAGGVSPVPQQDPHAPPTPAHGMPHIP